MPSPLTLLLLIAAFVLALLRFFVSDGRLTAGAVLALILMQVLGHIR